MPAPLFRAYVTMLPRLRAEESRTLVSNLIAGEGRVLEAQPYRQYMRSLEAAVDGSGRERGFKPSVRDLAEIGIRVVKEEVPVAKPKKSRKKASAAN